MAKKQKRPKGYVKSVKKAWDLALIEHGYWYSLAEERARAEKAEAEAKKAEDYVLYQYAMAQTESRTNASSSVKEPQHMVTDKMLHTEWWQTVNDKGEVVPCCLVNLLSGSSETIVKGVTTSDTAQLCMRPKGHPGKHGEPGVAYAHPARELEPIIVHMNEKTNASVVYEGGVLSSSEDATAADIDYVKREAARQGVEIYDMVCTPEGLGCTIR